VIIPDGITESAITLKDQFFDLKGLSVYSSLAVGTLRDYLRHGNKPVPHFKLKGKILVRKSEFDTWLEAFRVNRKQRLNGVVNEVMAGLKGAKSEE
jgi:hypothetical protein